MSVSELAAALLLERSQTTAQEERTELPYRRVLVAFTANVVSLLEHRVLLTRGRRHHVSKQLARWHQRCTALAHRAPSSHDRMHHASRQLAKWHRRCTQIIQWQSKAIVLQELGARHLFARHFNAWRAAVETQSKVAMLHDYGTRHHLGRRFDVWRASIEKQVFARLSAAIQEANVMLASPPPVRQPQLPATPLAHEPQQLQSVDALMASMHARAHQLRWALERWREQRRRPRPPIPRSLFERRSPSAEPQSPPSAEPQSPPTRPRKLLAESPLLPPSPNASSPPASFEMVVLRLRVSRNASGGAMRRWRHLASERRRLTHSTRKVLHIRLLAGLRSLAWQCVRGRRRAQLAAVSEAVGHALRQMNGQGALHTWRRHASSRSTLARTSAAVARIWWLGLVRGPMGTWRDFVRSQSAFVCLIRSTSSDAAHRRRLRHLGGAWLRLRVVVGRAQALRQKRTILSRDIALARLRGGWERWGRRIVAAASDRTIDATGLHAVYQRQLDQVHDAWRRLLHVERCGQAASGLREYATLAYHSARLRRAWHAWWHALLRTEHATELRTRAAVAYLYQLLHGVLLTMQKWATWRRFCSYAAAAGTDAVRQRALRVGLARLQGSAAFKLLEWRRGRFGLVLLLRSAMRAWRWHLHCHIATQILSARQHANLVLYATLRLGAWIDRNSSARQQKSLADRLFAATHTNKAWSIWAASVHPSRWISESRRVELSFHSRMHGYIRTLAVALAQWHVGAARLAQAWAVRVSYAMSAALKRSMRHLIERTRIGRDMAAAVRAGAFVTIGKRAHWRMMRLAVMRWGRHVGMADARRAGKRAMLDAACVAWRGCMRRARRQACMTWRQAAAARKARGIKMGMVAQLARMRYYMVVRAQRRKAYETWVRTNRTAHRLARQQRAELALAGRLLRAAEARAVATWRASTRLGCSSSRLLASRLLNQGWHSWRSGLDFYRRYTERREREEVGRHYACQRQLVRGWTALGAQRAVGHSVVARLASTTQRQMARAWMTWHSGWSETTRLCGLARYALTSVDGWHVAATWRVWRENAGALGAARALAVRATSTSHVVACTSSFCVWKAAAARRRACAAIAMALRCAFLDQLGGCWAVWKEGWHVANAYDDAMRLGLTHRSTGLRRKLRRPAWRQWRDLVIMRSSVAEATRAVMRRWGTSKLQSGWDTWQQRWCVVLKQRNAVNTLLQSRWWRRVVGGWECWRVLCERAVSARKAMACAFSRLALRDQVRAWNVWAEATEERATERLHMLQVVDQLRLRRTGGVWAVWRHQALSHAAHFRIAGRARQLYLSRGFARWRVQSWRAAADHSVGRQLQLLSRSLSGRVSARAAIDAMQAVVDMWSWRASTSTTAAAWAYEHRCLLLSLRAFTRIAFLRGRLNAAIGGCLQIAHTRSLRAAVGTWRVRARLTRHDSAHAAAATAQATRGAQRRRLSVWRDTAVARASVRRQCHAALSQRLDKQCLSALTTWRAYSHATRQQRAQHRQYECTQMWRGWEAWSARVVYCAHREETRGVTRCRRVRCTLLLRRVQRRTAKLQQIGWLRRPGGRPAALSVSALNRCVAEAALPRP